MIRTALKINLLILFGCAGVRTPQPEWITYMDVQQRRHIYNIDLKELSLAGENVTEYYYCLEHERLEEIKVFWPMAHDSVMTDPP